MTSQHIECRLGTTGAFALVVIHFAWSMFSFFMLSCALANLSCAIWNGRGASCDAPSYCARAIESLAPRIPAVGGAGEEHSARMTTKAKAPVVPNRHSICCDVMFHSPISVRVRTQLPSR